MIEQAKVTVIMGISRDENVVKFKGDYPEPYGLCEAIRAIVGALGAWFGDQGLTGSNSKADCALDSCVHFVEKLERIIDDIVCPSLAPSGQSMKTSKSSVSSNHQNQSGNPTLMTRTRRKKRETAGLGVTPRQPSPPSCDQDCTIDG